MTKPATPPFDLAKALDGFSRVNASVSDIIAHRDAIVAEFERLRSSLASAREDWASAQVSLDALTNAMQFIWDALDNDDEAEAFAMADRWRARSDSKEGV